MKPKRKKITLDEKRELARAYVLSGSWIKASRECGIKITTVRSLLRRSSELEDMVKEISREIGNKESETDADCILESKEMIDKIVRMTGVELPPMIQKVIDTKATNAKEERQQLEIINRFYMAAGERQIRLKELIESSRISDNPWERFQRDFADNILKIALASNLTAEEASDPEQLVAYQPHPPTFSPDGTLQPAMPGEFDPERFRKVDKKKLN